VRARARARARMCVCVQKEKMCFPRHGIVPADKDGLFSANCPPRSRISL